jgi:hypothetical protein
VEAEETKRVPHPTRAHRAQKEAFLVKDGGAIYDWFLELISRGSFAMPGLNRSVNIILNINT